jgi:hypothetical protein
MGRPSKLTHETASLIVNAVRAGLTSGLACDVAGITPRTFQRWMASKRPEHRQLREAVARARAGCEADLVARTTLAAHKGSWRAAAWLLERHYPERWGPPAQRRRVAPTTARLPFRLP